MDRENLPDENFDISIISINSSDDESSIDEPEPEEQNHEHHRMNEAMPHDIFIKKLIEIKTKYAISMNGMDAIISLIRILVRRLQISEIDLDVIFPHKNYKSILKRLSKLVLRLGTHEFQT